MGIDIKIHYSWFLILVLVYYSLAEAYFPLAYAGLEIWNYHVMAGIAAVLLFASVLFHEIFHAYVGNKNKVPVKSIVLFIFGGVSQIENEPASAKVELKMTVAGPLSSIFLAIVFFLLSLLPQPIQVKAIFDYLWQINAILAIFNIVPAFPLDGGRVLRAALWWHFHNIKKATRISVQISRFFSYLFIFIGLIFIIGGNIISGIWLGVIGWFVLQAAQQSYEQLMVKDILERTEVASLIQKNIPKVTLREKIASVLEKVFRVRVSELPVVEGENFRGVISLSRLKEIKKKKQVSAQEVMIPAISIFKLKPSDSAYVALTNMLRLGVNLLPVYAGKNYKGVVTKESLLFLLSFKE